MYPTILHNICFKLSNFWQTNYIHIPFLSWIRNYGNIFHGKSKINNGNIDILLLINFSFQYRYDSEFSSWRKYIVEIKQVYMFEIELGSLCII